MPVKLNTTVNFIADYTCEFSVKLEKQKQNKDEHLVMRNLDGTRTQYKNIMQYEFF